MGSSTAQPSARKRATARDERVPCDNAVAELELLGHRCTVVCVDGNMPRSVGTPDTARMRHVYHGAEIAHFQLGEHRFSLIASEALPATPAKNGGRDLRAVLTNRELQIVQLICMGLLTKQVADRLHLSEFTVRSYLKIIYCKLGVRSRGGMVFAYAKAFGLASAASLPTD